MIDFLIDIVAVVIGVCLTFGIYAYASADSVTKVTCDITTNNPVSQTTCVIDNTLN